MSLVLIPLAFLVLAIFIWPHIIPADELENKEGDNGWPCLADSPGSGYPDRED